MSSIIRIKNKTKTRAKAKAKQQIRCIIDKKTKERNEREKKMLFCRKILNSMYNVYFMKLKMRHVRCFFSRLHSCHWSLSFSFQFDESIQSRLHSHSNNTIWWLDSFTKSLAHTHTCTYYSIFNLLWYFFPNISGYIKGNSYKWL